MCTNENTLNHNINDGNKTGEKLMAKKLLLVTNNSQKNFWNTVKWNGPLAKTLEFTTSWHCQQN